MYKLLGFSFLVNYYFYGIVGKISLFLEEGL